MLFGAGLLKPGYLAGEVLDERANTAKLLQVITFYLNRYFGGDTTEHMTDAVCKGAAHCGERARQISGVHDAPDVFENVGAGAG